MHAVVRTATDLNGDQTFVATDPVVGMHDEIARRHHGQLVHERVGLARALGAANHAVAEHVLLGKERYVGRREAVLDRKDGEGDSALLPRAERRVPVVRDLERPDAVIAEQRLETVARALGVARQHDPVLCAVQLLDMRADRFVDVRLRGALGREIAGCSDAEVEHVAVRLGPAEVRRQVHVRALQASPPFLLRKVERVRSERAVAAGLLGHRRYAVGVVVAHRLEALLRREAGGFVSNEDVRAVEVVEHARQLSFQEREPVLHAGKPPTVADRLVERVFGRRGAEQVDVSAAEPLDRIRRQQRLRDG